jgi:hypothetical protein
MVRREIRRVLPGTVVFEQGVVVHTPFDAKIQDVATRAVRQALLDLDTREGHGGPKGHLDQSEWRDFLARAPGLHREPGGAKKPPQAGECFDALVPPGPDLDMLEAGPFAYRLDEASRKTAMRRADPERPAKTLAQVVEGGDIPRCARTEPMSSLDPHPGAKRAQS